MLREEKAMVEFTTAVRTVICEHPDLWKMTLLDLQQEASESVGSIVIPKNCARVAAILCVLYIKLSGLQHTIVPMGDMEGCSRGL